MLDLSLRARIFRRCLVSLNMSSCGRDTHVDIMMYIKAHVRVLYRDPIEAPAEVLMWGPRPSGLPEVYRSSRGLH